MRRIAFLLALAGLAQAKPGDGGVITDKDLEPYWQEYGKFAQDVRDRKRTVDEMLVHFRGLAQREKHPRKAAIRRYIHGVILMDRLKRPRDAKREFDAALGLFEQYPAVLGRLATLAHEAKDTKHAIRLLRRALELSPSYTKALNYLATIYAGQGKYEKAIKLFTESFDIDQNVAACVGLSMVHMRLYHDAYVEKRKRKQADAAVEWAENYMVLAPNDGNAYVVLARVLADVGRYPKAVKILEQAQIASITEGAKVATLNQLYMMHARRNRLKPAVAALKRMLKYDGLKVKARAEIEQKIKDLEENGGRVYLIWHVKLQMKILKNPGYGAKPQADAMRELLRFYTDREVLKMKKLADLREEVFKTAFRSMKDSPPEVTIEIFRFFQMYGTDPSLLRILAHFIYPADDAKRTPEVRREAVRTIALLGETAALPTLWYCLRDEPGMVLREVERHLAKLCETRSKVGEGMEPLNRAQAKLARKEWRKHFIGDEGAEKLLEALTKLRKCLDMEPGFNRSVQTKPMADHIASMILLDNDMPFATWLAAYKFLRDYLAKDFRPVSERDKPVTERNRKAITAAIEDFFGGKATSLPEVNNGPVKKKPAETKRPK